MSNYAQIGDVRTWWDVHGDGEPLVLEDERDGTLHAYLVTSVSEGEAVTSVEVTPTVKSGIPKGWLRVHAAPQERVAPLAPASKGVQLGKALQLTEEPVGLQPGDIVWISDGQQPLYRRVMHVRGRRLLFDEELGARALCDETELRPSAGSPDPTP